VILLSLKLERVITEPLAKLANMAKTISKERDYSVRAVKESDDETGSLVDAFNDMLAQLYTHQVQLEQLVKDRTAALEQANEDLYREIEERKAAEVKLRSSLDQKSTLLGEVHHRVRNNLQIIVSLLGLTHRRTLNAEARQILEETRSRIFAMAMIHSHLYRSGNFNQIDMKDHIDRLWSSIQQVNGVPKRRVTPVIQCKGVYLSLPQAIPCSLVLNEAITNVFKYAYEEGEEGPCHISMNPCGDGRVCMRIRDEGRGIPDTVDVEATETLGLKLMRNLVRQQLEGEFRIERNGGTDIRIEFSLAPEYGIAPEKPNGSQRAEPG
jgi:two-component sensor histidine kinase/HAMP domain-containing protein